VSVTFAYQMFVICNVVPYNISSSICLFINSDIITKAECWRSGILLNNDIDSLFVYTRAECGCRSQLYFMYRVRDVVECASVHELSGLLLAAVYEGMQQVSEAAASEEITATLQ